MLKKELLMKRVLIGLLICLGVFLLFAVIYLLNQQTNNETNNGEAENSTRTEMYRVTKIIDGDTFEIENGEIVRMICIDAPEKGKKNYKEASEYLESLVLDREIRLEKDVSEKDEYGRLLRYVYFEDRFVNELIVLNGYAKSFPYGQDVTLCPIIEKAELDARENGRGELGDINDNSQYPNLLS